MNDGFGLAPNAIGARGADALQATDEGGQEVRGRTRRCTVRWPDAAGTSEVYFTLTCSYIGSQRSRLRGRRRADGPHAGRSAREPRADRRHADTAPPWAETAQREDAAHRPPWCPAPAEPGTESSCLAIAPPWAAASSPRPQSATPRDPRPPGAYVGWTARLPFSWGGGACPRPAQLISGPLPSGLPTAWTSGDG